jgi:hypothetical protein
MKDALPFLFALGVIAAVVAYLMYALMRPGGPRGRGPGSGATGAVYDMLNEDKRKAIEIIVEGRAEATDPEHADDGPNTDARKEVKKKRS